MTIPASDPSSPAPGPDSGPRVTASELELRRKLFVPALMLMASGTVGAVHWFMLLIDLMLNQGKRRADMLAKGMTDPQIQRIFAFNYLAQAVLMVLALTVVWAGLNGLIAYRPRMVVVGAVLAIIPLVPAYGAPVGIVGGLWMLWRLRDADTRRIMARVRD